MRWSATLAALAAAAIPLAWTLRHGEEPCTGGFDASFVQIGDAERSFDEARWLRELTMLHDLGVTFLIVQYTGDERGAYDHGERAPVASLLRAAARLEMKVMIGLYDDPTWPSDRAVRRLPPPLEDPHAAAALASMCAQSTTCVGWYIPQEIDDETWSARERTAALRDHLTRTSRILRELTPGKEIAIAPFFAGELEPADYARWWLDVLEPGAVDILILQDGVGTGRASPERAGEYLRELRPALCSRHVELWSVVELFQQVHGLPIDHRPFAAFPMDPVRLRHSLTIETPLVERVVAFAVLPYMDPQRGTAARRLHDVYAARCRAPRLSRRTPC